MARKSAADAALAPAARLEPDAAGVAPAEALALPQSRPGQNIMTAAPAAGGPRPGCPAIAGRGTDLDTARFTLVAEDCERGPDGQMRLTEVFGYYQVPGQDSDDLIHADGFAVPIGSPAAIMARKVARSRHRTRIVGNVLRAAISECRCAPAGGCPAYDDIAMLEAIEHAAGQPALPRWICLIRPRTRTSPSEPARERL